MNRRLAPVLALALAGFLPFATAAPAHAEGELGLSHDGAHWDDVLAHPLFDPAARWTPGDVQTARFYVRNQATELGDLSVDVNPVTRDTLLETGYLAVSARAGDQPWTTISGSGGHELIDSEEITAGQSVAVDIRVALTATAPNPTMLLGADLDFTVTLSDARAISGGGDDGGGGNGNNGDGDGNDNGDGDNGGGTGDATGDVTGDDYAGGLPATGSDVAPWLPPLALLMLGAGAYLVGRRRTSRDDAGDLSQS